METLWLIIGRFQPLHIWHKLLISESLAHNSDTIMLIGSWETRDKKNPYSFNLRKKIIQTEYRNKKLSLYCLPDFPEDEDWIKKIISFIPENTLHIHLYCWDIQNDYAIQVLKTFYTELPFSMKIIEIPRSIIPVSATQIRNWIRKNNNKELKKYISNESLEILKEEKLI